MSAPGWYPDPSTPGGQRWWDGTQWTSHQQAPAAAPAQGYAAAPPVTGYGVAPARVNVETNTVWIWLAIVASLLPVLSLFLIDWDSYIRIVTESTATGRPATAELLAWQGQVLGVSALSYVAAAAFIVFSWLDWRELRRRGVPAPFHWAWSFFALLGTGAAVYVIGRTVVLRRRTTTSPWVPLWVWIGGTVASFIIATVWILNLVSELTSRIIGTYSGA